MFHLKQNLCQIDFTDDEKPVETFQIETTMHKKLVIDFYSFVNKIKSNTSTFHSNNL